MRLALLISVPIVVPAMVAAQQLTPGAEIPLTPPGYKMLRFDEDYSYLTNQANRTDLFDPVKYVPLRQDDPLWYATFGGELRERYEGYYNPNFGIGGKGSVSYLLQRITLLTDVHLGDRLRFFAEGISGVIAGESHPAPPVQDDPIDLQFAFVDAVPWLKDDERLTLRVGRFGMSFGAGRLVATRAAPNIPFRFDGFEALYSRPLWNVTAFLTQPVKDSGHIDSEDHSTTFWGIYATHYFDAPHTLGLDLYYLGIHRKGGKYASGSGDEHRHTLGAREFATRNHWDWEGEQVLQVGSFGNESILAWSAAINGGYTWDTTWNPRLGLKAGATSGDVHPNLTLHPLPKVTIDGGASPFWRYSRNDAVYGVPGFVEIPALHNASSYVGTAFDMNLTWQLQRHVTAQASYVHFLTGSYVHQAGGSDVDYFSTTITFFFDMAASAQPIQVAITRRIKPGREQEFQTALKEFFARSLAESGVHGAAMLVPPPGSGSAEYGIIRSFASAAERDAFYASPLYLDWKKRVTPLSDGEPEARELHGLEAFFRQDSRDPAPPPRWKMAIATYLGVVPVIMTLALTLSPLIRSWNFVLNNLVFNACVVALLTWVVMPLITRVLRAWLQPTSRKPPTDNEHHVLSISQFNK